MNRKLIVITAVAVAATLSGCGRMGELDRPAPLSGPAPRADADTAPRDPDETIARTADPRSARDRDIAPAPPRTLPIGGSGSDPFAVAPQGVLPDPYANPQ